MASKLLQLLDDFNFLKNQLVLKKQKKCAAHIISDLISRIKAIEHRALSYGKRGNLFQVSFGGYDFYFTDITEEDIQYLVAFHSKKLGLHNPDYTFKNLTLGEAIKK